LAILTLLQWLGYASLFGGVVVLSLLASAVGTGLMAYGTWQEYQATSSKPATGAQVPPGPRSSAETGSEPPTPAPPTSGPPTS
jgi:hypothetical protein